MSQRATFKAASLARLRDARALYDAGRYDACIYLAGFALEMALKARVMKHLAIEGYPNDRFFRTHDLDQLLMLSGLAKRVNGEPVLLTPWSVVADHWDPTSRYDAPGKATERIARDVLDAVSDQEGGLVSWLKTRW